MVDWRIYYGDGTTFSSDDGRPEEAPAFNIQVIVQRDPEVGKQLSSGNHYYWWSWTDGWYGGDLFGLFDYLSQPGYKIVKFGRSIPNRLFHELSLKAAYDKDFPVKSAFAKDERRP